MFLTREAIDQVKEMRVCDIVSGSDVTDSFYSQKTTDMLEFLFSFLIERLGSKPRLFRIVPRYDKQIIIEFVSEPVIIINQKGYLTKYADLTEENNDAQ